MGAGPAGNMTALRLAELGHGVLVLDWRENLGDKLCTGIIGNECAQQAAGREILLCCIDRANIPDRRKRPVDGAGQR